MIPVLLLCLVIVGVIFLACYGAYLYGKKRRIDPEARAHVDKELNKMRILETVYDEEKINKIEERTRETVLKIHVLEKLNISPDTLKSCVKELKGEKLIIEGNESVILTTFGVQYCEVFIKNERENNGDN